MGAPVVSPREWIGAIGGTPLVAAEPGRFPGLDVGVFRFGDLPERLDAPAIDHHYVSFTIRGPLHVERLLGDGVERADFRPGHSLIMAAGQPNAWRWTRPTDELHLYVHPGYLADVAADAGLPEPELIDRFAFDDPLLRQLAFGLVEELRRPAAAGDLFGEATAHLVALHLVRRHASAAPPREAAPGRLTAAQLRRVRDAVDAGLGGPLTVADLATAAGLSRFHFARAFRATTGEPPHRYVLRRRIERARALLASADLPVAEVAGRVGFATASHFSQAFRVAVGTSPAAYRRARRG